MKWSENEKQILQSNWGNVKQHEMKLLLPNRNIQAIQKMAQRMNLDGRAGYISRKYHFDTDYFNTLNRENCYWAGFIAADGYIYNRDKSVAIGLARKDRVMLEEFKRVTNYNGIIFDYINEKDNTKSSKLTFYGADKWINVLFNTFHIHQAKSLTLRPPSGLTDIELIYSFIIGYFDGDGTAHWSKNGKYGYIFNFGVVGTYRMLSWIKGYVDLLAPESIHGEVNIGEANGYPRIIYRGQRALEIHKILKNFELPFRLKRKWYLNDK